MSVIVLDFETYYDKEYSLRKMTPVEYLLDPRFEVTGCAVIDPTLFEVPTFLAEPAFAQYVGFKKALKQPVTALSHNALFDMCLLAWHYDFVPDLMVDTMGMSRALLFAFIGYVSLEKIADYLELPAKGKMITNVSGMRAKDIKDAGLWPAYSAYACHDAWLCEQIFKRLAPQLPKEEFLVMDMVLRCTVIPRFKLNADLLAWHKHDLAAQKEALLARCGISKMELMSNPKFADALRQLGVEPPMKTSPATGLETYAFAKSDPDMVQLAESPREDVQALVAARVGHKSTLAETRAERLLNISTLPWPGNRGAGWAPIPLRYSGAHTHRLSGDWGLNAQNWPKYSFNADGTKETGVLRRAHEAPEGFKVVKRDASQIEARIVAWLAGQADLVEAFAKGEDIYSDFAEHNIYHYPVNKTTVDERFVGKQVILGMGYGMGPPKFVKHTAVQSFNALGRAITIDDGMAVQIVREYRNRFDQVPKAWDWLREHIPVLAREDSGIEFGPVKLGHQRVLLPNGLPLFYHNLHFDKTADNGRGQWTCEYGKKPKRIFGGKLYENVVQALARILTMGAALKMQQLFPHLPRLAHQVHDDLIYIVPDEMVREVDEALAWCMNRTPDWAAGLPLASEGGIGQNYGDAK